MPRYRMTLEYMGTRYSGWQVQKNARTVQGEIAESVRKVSGSLPLEFTGAGRTDAGVHALHQVAHLDLPQSQSPEKLRRELNDALPADIHILNIETASHRFHARHHAVARSYLYQVSTRRSAFGKKLVWWVREELSILRMERAAALFLGMKDCRSFTADDPGEKSTKVLIEKLAVEKAGDLVLIRIEGSHFLWKMVRRIVGVLVEAGKGSLTLEQVSRFLVEESKEPARLAAPASGLFLERVYYEGEERLTALEPVLRISSI
jgi:tRNA pseudouridine38-40 synthase